MPFLTRPYRLILTLGGVDFVSTARYKDEDDALDVALELNEVYTPIVGMERYYPDDREWRET